VPSVCKPYPDTTYGVLHCFEGSIVLTRTKQALAMLYANEGLSRKALDIWKQSVMLSSVIRRCHPPEIVIFGYLP
jgi:hypothetical protein